jgi:UDP-N-acetylmuramate dehydrogenase
VGYETSDFPQLFQDKVGKPLEQSVLLRDYSNFRIGGPADFFFEANSRSELVTSVCLAREQAIPYHIIGGGYNILFDDDGFRGLIIRNRVESIKHKQKRGEIEVFSGTPLNDVLQFSVDEELSGFEFLAGIPGTIGGAIFGNAGAFGQSIGQFLKEAEILDQKCERVRVKRDYFEFRYRYSLLKEEQNIILVAIFELQEGEREEIKTLIGKNLEQRKEKHPPWDVPCAGSFFKNPVFPDGKRVPAAYLLDKVGAKKLAVGGAAVYKDQANFIINRENASAKDVLQLAAELKQRVKSEYDIDLEEEVIFLPASPSLP